MFTRAIIFMGALFYSSSAFAQSPVGSMESFYNKSKNSLNTSTTIPGVYESQSRYALTGGSFVWRAEQENATLLNYELPAISAGCGGIDIFAGSFSFINGDQLEALMRSIIQDAAGYAFSLAIAKISPAISTELKNMMANIKELNGQNINSCEIASGLVDSAVDVYNHSRDNSCKLAGSAKGVFSDALAGRVCGGDDSKSQDSIKAAQEAGDVVMTPLNANLAMQATDKLSTVDDLKLREFYMSITGTLVIQSGDKLTYNYVPPIAVDESVAGAIMRGGEIKGHKCAAITLGSIDYSEEDCLSVLQNTATINLAAADGYLIRVQDILSSIYDKTTGASTVAYTAQEIAFVEDTPIPVLRAAQIFSQANPGTGRGMLLSYSELIAYEMALNYLENISRLILDAGQQNPGANQGDLEAWRTGIRANIKALVDMQSQLQLRYMNVQATINQLNTMQDRITAKVNTNLLRVASSSVGR